jgi:hypothetical protein
LSDELKSSVDGSSGVDFRAWYGKNGFAWGAGDMFVVSGGKPSTRIAEVIAVLAASFHKDGNPVFSEIVVVQPPASTSADERMTALLRHLDEVVRRSRGMALEPAEIAALSSRIRIVVPPDLQNDSVLSIIAAAKHKSGVVVEEAALYRGPARTPSGPAPILRMPEDSWVPHFHALCEGAIAAAKASETYVALDANEDWPFKEDNRNLLLSIDRMAVLAGDHPEGSQTILAQYIEKWTDGIKRGVIGPILAEIDALPDALDGIKPLLKLQMMHKAGLHPMVEHMLRTEPHLVENLASLPSLQVAEMAADAGAPDIARKLLQKIAFDQSPMEAIEGALALAKRIAEPGSIQNCEGLLREKYPASLALLRHRADGLVEAGNFSSLAQLLAGSPIEDDKQLAGFYEALATGLASPTLDYQGLARSIIAAHPVQVARARLLIAREAVRAQRYADALSVAAEAAEQDVTVGIVSTVLSALETALLTRDKNKEIGLDPELAQAGVLLVLRYLAHHPDDARVRVRLVDVLSAESMGLLGIAFLVSSALKLASAPLSLRDIRTLDTWMTAPPADETTAFLKVALPWLQSASPVFIGRVDMPKELLTLDADKLVTGISRVLEHYEPLDTPADVATVRNILAVGMAVARHGSIPDTDLALVRVLAVRLALASRFQAARDYAEHALQVAGESRARARLAWLCYGDVYQRIGNTIDALIGGLCCLAADDSATPEQIFYESLLLYRLMRDLRMIDVGLSFLDAARKALERFGALDRYVHRIETLQLQARLLQTRQADPEHLRARLESLLPDLAHNAHAVLAQDDEPAPAAANMAEALRIAEAAGVKPPPDAVEAFELLLKQSHAPLRATIAASRLAHPTAAQVLEAVQQMELAREANDVVYDLRQISIFAERLLGSEETLASPPIAAFAIEVLADHGIPLPGAANARRDWIPPTIDASGKLAAELSTSMDLPIVLIGVDADGRLIRSIAEHGMVRPPLRESLEVFSENRLRQWSQEFPFRYGVDEETFNLFHTTTEGLGIGDLPPRAVLVTSANIQHWTPNLIRIGAEFAGQTRRLAAAPSLTWLKAARLRRATDRRALAWIPKESSDEGAYTLQSVVDRVAAPLATHGVSLDTTSVIPSNLEGAELVIIAAHGGLVPGNRYFQVVRDDADLKIAGSDVSSALKNVGVAVLFVCSGGRLDPHPMAITTLGLPRQILGNGCMTVIASPWPIDSRIPSYWLPAFLEAWNAGLPVIDATFEANARVRDAFSTELRDCLAMSVYGDPLRTKER